MFELINVTYKDILSIENLSIPENKITSLVGESGSGKTTLMRLLNKMISPSTGDIFYKDNKLSKLNTLEHRRNIVMLSQSPVIFPGNIKENLIAGIIFSEKNIPDDTKLEEVLNLIYLNKNLTEDAENLSGGEKQRLALGRVLLMDPDVLLLDEPSSALDDDSEQLVINNVCNYIIEKGKSLLMVTHSREIAKSFSNYIIEINDGRVISNKEV
ncbi:ABC transporter ATP-binding protein [Serpentinicella sp. ANB-PHB4]|uniref:ABC transporter ATP-binding protein n=1 Tax=Serpentinicella sp. ANB-PHB4 TaxID=3074076 RepID=UPI002855978B|nr:ABC transporter ATP-binding protein [Serpentinicella sp. ANB-PHB4]MDR5659685.1 ABC transporter ATP-binding protein [Serpentinicella sp. ANB-PHB4]